MKLLRYGPPGGEKPGMLDADGTIRDLSPVLTDLTGDALSDASLDRLRALDPAALPAVPGQPRLGPPVAGVGKFCCIGLNFTDHAIEAGMEIPDHPVLFMKATSAICGPNDTVMMPRGSTRTDWEIELAVVIGTAAKHVSEDRALDHVAGYTIANDVSERDFQLNLSGTWTKGKSCDTFGPLGPWLVTRDEIADVHNLDMTLDVNGERMQTGNTRTMSFSIAHIVSHLSQLFTLHPGDVIATGTPPGVGMGYRPQKALRAGDVMTLAISGLGQQELPVAQEP